MYTQIHKTDNHAHGTCTGTHSTIVPLKTILITCKRCTFLNLFFICPLNQLAHFGLPAYLEHLSNKIRPNAQLSQLNKLFTPSSISQQCIDVCNSRGTCKKSIYFHPKSHPRTRTRSQGGFNTQMHHLGPQQAFWKSGLHSKVFKGGREIIIIYKGATFNNDYICVWTYIVCDTSWLGEMS